MTEPIASSRPGRVARLLDRSQARGRFIVSIDELARDGALSRLAARRQLEHLSDRVERLPGRPSSYLLMPAGPRTHNALPVAVWLDEFFRLRNRPYYLGLLSAAALYTSSKQPKQLAQVLSVKPMRPLAIAGLHIDFYVKSNLRRTPTSVRPEVPISLAVSSPEATALDLIAFNHRIGGIHRVVDVIADLKRAMTPAGLESALRAESQIAVRQRLGYIFSVLGLKRMAEEVRRSLPKRLAPTPLQTQTKTFLTTPVTDVCQPWMILDNVGLAKPTRRHASVESWKFTNTHHAAAIKS